MHGLLVPAKRESDTPYFVLKNSLEHLIRERKVQQIRRSNGWLAVDGDQRRKGEDGYLGPERRVCRIVDCALFPLSIEEQLHRGLPVEAILGYGRRAREVAAKLKSVASTNLSVLIQGKNIFYLATKFLATANAELGKHVFGFSQEAIDFLSCHDWSGNIRELKNIIKKAALFANEVIEAEHLLSTAREGRPAASLDGLLENAFVKGLPLPAINDVIREAVEKKIIERVYEQSHKNKKKTCEALGIDYSTLYRKMKEYG